MRGRLAFAIALVCLCVQITPGNAQDCLLQDPDAYARSIAQRPLSLPKLVRGSSPFLTGANQSAPSQGTISIPVLAGKYADTGPDPASPAELNDALFGYPPGDPAHRNLTDYFDEVSYGYLYLDGQVYGTPTGGLIQGLHSHSYYLDHPDAYVKDIVEAADPYVDFSQYDADEDGYVDWVAVVFPTIGSNCQAGPISSDSLLTPHFGRLSLSFSKADTTDDGVIVDDFSIEPLLSCDLSGRVNDIGTYAHEFGHGLGIHDLYKNGSVSGGNNHGIGFWGVMGAGSLGVLGNLCGLDSTSGFGSLHVHPDSPTHMNPRSKEWLGWIQPGTITTPGSYSLHSMESTGDCIRIAPGGSPDPNADEYFLLEYRRAQGFDRDIPGEGLAIWRVTRSGECPPADVTSPTCSMTGDIGIEIVTDPNSCPINGLDYGSETNLLPVYIPAFSYTSDELDDNSDPSPSHSMRLKDGTPSGLAIRNIQVSQDSLLISFDLEFEPGLFDVSNVPTSGGIFRSDAWGDADGDGDPDLYVAKGQTCLSVKNCGYPTPPDPPNELRLAPDWELAAGNATIDDPTDSWSAAWADWDNDGDLDMALANSLLTQSPVSNSRILRNDGCTQTSCNFSSAQDTHEDFRAVAWADVTGDGLLDVYFGGPTAQALFVNDGSGFQNEFTSSGIDNSLNVVGASFADYDDDGDPDLLLLVDGASAVIYRNDTQNGVVDFSDDTPNISPFVLSSAVWFDYDNDGDLDLYATRTGDNNLLLNNGNGPLKDKAASANVQYGTDATTEEAVSVVALDYDNDGDLDLYVAHSNADNTLFSNLGDGTFENVTQAAISGYSDDVAVAAADADLDGDVDIALERASSMKLLVNRAAMSGTNHWLEVHLAGVANNSSGVGARVEATIGSTTQIREVSGGTGKSQDSPVAHFGLGQASTVDQLTVYWPDGKVTTRTNVAADQQVTVSDGIHGAISQNTTWSGRVFVDGDILIDQQVTLTIDPGTAVLFAVTDAQDLEQILEDQVELFVKGVLQVNGTQSEPVIFKSASSSPGTTDWGHIAPQLSGTVDMTYAEIRDSQYGLETATSGTVSLTNCTFAHNGSDNLVTSGASVGAVVCTDCTINVDSGVGIDMHAGSGAMTLSGCTITGTANSSYGIHMNGGSTLSLTCSGDSIADFSSGYGAWITDGTSVWTDNEVSGCNVGIMLRKGIHTLGETGGGNVFSGNGTGLYVYKQAPGTCPTAVTLDVTVRNDAFDQNDYGVITEKTAAPDLGNSSDAGNNSFTGSTTYCVWNKADACGTVTAVGNYWETACQAPTCTQGPIDASDPLCSPPQLVASKPRMEPELPKRTALIGAVPNPFNPTTNIQYSIRETVPVQIDIYNVVGGRVRSVDLGVVTPGIRGWVWDGRDQAGQAISSGIYFVVLHAGNVVDTRKAVMLK